MGGELSTAYGWLVAGAFLLALEAFGVPGAGFLFAGLAAIVVGLLVQFDAVGSSNYILQAGLFGALTALLAALLWRQLKRWRGDSAEQKFSNIVGDLATVGKGGLDKGVVGQASWSGTTMMAEIDPKAACERLEEGAMVEITAVKGNHLYVAPRNKAA